MSKTTTQVSDRANAVVDTLRTIWLDEADATRLMDAELVAYDILNDGLTRDAYRAEVDDDQWAMTFFDEAENFLGDGPALAKAIAEVRTTTPGQTVSWRAVVAEAEEVMALRAETVREALREAGERRAEADRQRAGAMLDTAHWLIEGQRAGLSVAELSRLAGVTRQTVYDLIERQ